MGKLDRQLDEIKGVRKVEVVWPLTDEMYLEQVRGQLKKEIDSHVDRVPLDLRQVHGAPDGLVDLLFDMKEYADSRGKNLVVAYALEEMREALGPKRHSKTQDAKSSVSELPDASEIAREALSSQLTPIQSIHHSARAMRAEEGTTSAERARLGSRISSIRFPKFRLGLGAVRKSKKPLARRIMSIGLISICGTALLVSGYWLYVFKLSPDSVDIEPPRKSFETSQVQ